MSRVLMTADAVGGVWSSTIERVDGLRPQGVEVTLAARRPALYAEIASPDLEIVGCASPFSATR